MEVIVVLPGYLNLPTTQTHTSLFRILNIRGNFYPVPDTVLNSRDDETNRPLPLPSESSRDCKETTFRAKMFSPHVLNFALAELNLCFIIVF